MDTLSPSYLPVRLKRETPFKKQLGCTGVIAVILAGVATLGFFMAKSPEDNSWIGYVVCAVFGFFALLLVWSFFGQLAAIGLKETIVEISADPLQPGESAKICLIQPGPAKLKSLRVNLICMEERRRKVWNSSLKTNTTQTDERMLSTENLLEATHLRVAAGDVWHEIRDFSLPADAVQAGTKGDTTVRWKIEVWGVGYVLASFMHPFPVDVFQGKRPEEEDYTDEDDL